MASFLEELGRIKDQVVTYGGELSSILDFGVEDEQYGPYQYQNYSRNPEMDLTEYDRTNPTELNDGDILGIPRKYVGYGLGFLAIVATVVIVKKSIK